MRLGWSSREEFCGEGCSRSECCVEEIVSIETVFVRYLFFSILLCGFLRFNVVNKRLIVLNFSYSFGSFENAF